MSHVRYKHNVGRVVEWKEDLASPLLERVHVVSLGRERFVVSTDDGSKDALVASQGNAAAVEQSHVFLQGGESFCETFGNHRSHARAA